MSALRLSTQLSAAFAALCLLAAPGTRAQRALAGDGNDQAQRYFALPLPRAASARAETILEHLAAGRSNQALTELQRLFEHSAHDLLGDRWRGETAEPSIFPSYPGALRWARGILMGLDAGVQERYRERFEGPARAALVGALGNFDEEALVRVAQRWPITRAAEEAWWALGDLEAERGFLETARSAWNRARELVLARGGDLPAGLEHREQLLERVLPNPTARGQGAAYGSAALLDPDVPRTDSDRWFLPLDLEPFGGRRRTDGFPIQPLHVDDQILINTSLRLFAVDAFTGTVRWESKLHDYWGFIRPKDRAQYFDNVDREKVLIGVAAAQGIAVANMQLPYSEFSDTSWQGIPIFRRIPERRLFAFDMETGAALWDHAPNLSWTGPSRGFELRGENSFAQLATVAGPPLIAGSRVFVPTYRLQSRIEYHVACFALETGALLWETPVISGQRERNMFGRAASEFVAAPLVIADGLIIAQTELGAISALDVLSGELVWSSEYSQVPIQPNTSSLPARRIVTWRVAPPVVVDGLIIATPSDSSSMACLELDDGAVRWSLSAFDLKRLGRDRTERYEFDYLIGADENTVYLGGEKIAALQKSGGLRSRLSFQPRWEHLAGRGSDAGKAPRPLLTPDVIVLANKDERLALDRRTGERINLLCGTWTPQDRGELLLGDGVLWSLGRWGLVGLFDWQTLIARQRARLTAAPQDPRVRMDTAALYLRRARSLRENEGETNQARRFLRDARDLLRARFEAQGTGADLLTSDRTAAAFLHELLREEARVLADLTRTEQAQAALREALALAPTTTAVRDTLLQEAALLRSGRGSARLAVLEELDRRAGSLPLSSEQLEASPTWLIGEALLSDGDLAGWGEAELTVSLWSLLSQADELARQRRGEEALVALHGALAQFGSVALNAEWTVADVIQERIARRIQIDGPQVYARFEAQAQELLRAALERGDDEGLRLIADRYAFSRAARQAEVTLLERSFQAKDSERVAELTQDLLRRAQEEGAASDETLLGALVRLGLLLEGEGNHGFLSALLAREAQRSPSKSLDVPGLRGKPLARLAEEHHLPPALPSAPNFGQEVRYLRHEPGLHEPVGELVERSHDGALTRHMLFAVASRRVVAYDLEQPDRPSWSKNIPFGADPTRIAVDEGRVLVGSRNMVRAFDSHGRLAWQRDVGDDLVRALEAGDGVVLALVGPSRSEHRLMAWDARNGVPLWEVELLDAVGGAVQGWLRPIIGGGRAIVFRRRFTENSTAVLIDLFSGSMDAVVDLGPYGSKDVLNRCAWIQDGRLCVPRFESRGTMGSTLGIYDLEDGRELWRMDFGDDEHFYAVARHGDQSYLVIHSSALRRGQNRGAVYRLDLDTRRIRAIESIRPGDLSAGLPAGRTTELAAPYLFFVPVGGNAQMVPLRVLDLEAGRSQSIRLPVSQREFYAESLPMPVVSKTSIALAFRIQDPDTQLVAMTRLEFIPRGDDGRLGSSTTGGLVLAQAGGSYQPVQLLGYGRVLFVAHGNTDGAARLDAYGGKR